MILHHESFFPRVPLKLHSRHLLHVISIHRLYAALLIMKLHQELAVRFTQENHRIASSNTYTLCTLRPDASLAHAGVPFDCTAYSNILLTGNSNDVCSDKFT